MLFSATMAHKVLELAYEHMNQAQLIKIQSETPAADHIDQSVYHPANHEKIPLLLGLMRKLKPERSIIFANTKHATIRIWEYLQGNGFPAALISGDIPQNKRESLLNKFHRGEFATLVATDVASRGLHIPDVTHIFNFDLPELGEDYVHRIGRTARVGNSGHAISFACEEYAMNLIDIEDFTGRPIPTMAISNDLLSELSPPIRMKKSNLLSKNNNSSRKSGNRPRQGTKRHQNSRNKSRQQTN
jgi:ATP-dependent RNA helicase RhlB